jgi:hypothetical protein
VKPHARTLILLVAALSGCAAGTNAIVESLQYAVGRGPDVESKRLNPDFRYLRATVDGRVVLLVLGYVDRHPQGPIQVWYSAEREVLRLQNGRIVGATGLTTEWRNVTVPELPTWSVLARIKGDSRWIRVRDVMPGYRYGIRDPLALRVSLPPSRSALQNLDSNNLVWFEERTEAEESGKRIPEENNLPPARYAVAISDGAESVVYGEQCLAKNLCFSWQLWPVAPQSAKTAQ